MFSACFLFLLCFCFLWVVCLDYGYTSLKGPPIFLENNSHYSDDALYGVMKVLTFNNQSSLYVGGRNAIYKFDVHNLKLLKTTNDSHPIWTFSPVYDRTYTSGNWRKNRTYWEPIQSTIDSCLSYVDRRRMDWDEYTAAKMHKVFTELPGAGMRFWYKWQWIRFRKQFEDFICNSAFIRGLEKIKLDNGTEVLWACGSFGSFPKAFLLDPDDLRIINDNLDSTLPTCARWPDEPMMTKVDDKGDLYIGSGWGLYKPVRGEEHKKKEKSMMLYSDWKMLTSGHHWFTRMAMVLGRDVVFLPRVFETPNHYFFFGHEVTPSLTYINSLTREVSQSFMLRVCKNDPGFKYTAEEDVAEIRKWRNLSGLDGLYTYDEGLNFTYDQLYFSYSANAYDDVYRVPTKHFVSAQKLPFGCYLKRYDGAQSLNRFWGEQNIVYFNRLADVNFSSHWVNETGDEAAHFKGSHSMPDLFPDDYWINDISYARKIFNPNTDVWNPLIAAFSSPGMKQRRRWRRKGRYRTGEVRPKGAICQFQITEWKTDAKEKLRDPPPPDALFEKEYINDLPANEPYKSNRDNRPKNRRQFPFTRMNLLSRADDTVNVSIKNRAQEFIALYGSQMENFFSRNSHWFQGGQIPKFWGLDLHATPNFTVDEARAHEAALNAGQCLNSEEAKKLTTEDFLSRMKTASTAWPTEWDTAGSKYFDAVYHMNPMQVAGDNASFVYDGVEFAKMFVMRWNYSDYRNGSATSPLVYLTLVTTEAEVFRVVMCDIASIPIKSVTCEMNHTDQPYVTRMFQYSRYNHAYWDKEKVIHDPLDRRFYHRRAVRDSKFKQFRVSSLLSIWRAGTKADEQVYPHDEDWQAPLLKDALMDAKGETLTLLTSKRIIKLNITIAAVCDTYKACIHCASDPMCEWFKKENRCRPYDKTSSEESVQDVHNRGFSCINLLNDTVYKTFQVTQRDAGIRLRCDNWHYFRGAIRWFHNGERIDLTNSIHRSKFVISEYDNSLIVLPGHLSYKPDGEGAVFTCQGVSMDDGTMKLLAAYNETAGVKPDCDYCSQCNNKYAIFDNFLACKESNFCK